MNFYLERFNEGSLESFRKEVNLDEQIDYNADFIVARDNDNKITGLAGVNISSYKQPRFEHILIVKKYQHTKLCVVLIKKIEELLKRMGYKNMTAYILNTRKKMMDYAEKYKFIPYHFTDKGVWYYKPLI